ncbi:MAG: ATP-binding cassette domain-containing protein [Treponema sp.]|jgi:simple sugar transport system ATP-binding protein|nr:ATP-binding cassette domain-containing protein [Treponema sp.]
MPIEPIELKGIQKYFPVNGVQALEDADFELKPGEIHALLGENGAGKSTLMHVMAGYLKPDSGFLVTGGALRRCFSSPAKALAAGIGMVRQHPHPVPGLKVWEDCTLGAEGGFLLHPAKARRRAAELSERWSFDLPMDSPAESLTVSQRQKAAVLALLLKGVRWFVFDEPAAVLSPKEAAALFDLFRGLRNEGRGIVLISHKLDEALDLADRVTVIRRGKTLGARKAASLSAGELRELIFGAAGSIPAANTQTGTAPAKSAGKDAGNGGGFDSAAGPAEPLLLLRDLKAEIPGRPFIRNISLELRAGEILGVTGVRDSGLETLELAVTGFLGVPGRSSSTRRADLSGLVRIRGRDVSDVRSFREAGGAYLGADRLGVNLAPELPLRESLIIHAWRRSRLGFWGKFGIMNKKFLDARCRAIMNHAGISRSSGNRGNSFSGGMLQRILLCRELEENASLLVLAEPGWGLDQVGRTRMAGELRACAASGKGVLLFSTDVDELLSVCSEIAVLFNGMVSARIVPGKGLSLDNAKVEIGRAMIGQPAGSDIQKKEKSHEF